MLMPMPTGVLVVLLFSPMMSPAMVSFPPVASTTIPVATFSTSNPRMMSLAPEIMQAGPGGGVQRRPVDFR